ncbi:hypothetical protein BGW39_004424 [Mortierella sp. 14UC]|nr:hypothetical protein BGW39_004424 [Mortierella sp. 14UC]
MTSHPQGQTMYLIPEVLDLIASYLPFASIHPCLLVCRLWNDIFTRHFWRSVKDRYLPWFRIMAPERSNFRNSSRIRKVLVGYDALLQDLVKKNGHHIRELVMSEGRILAAALDARVSNLTSLEVHACIDYGRLDREPLCEPTTLVPRPRIEVSENFFAELYPPLPSPGAHNPGGEETHDGVSSMIPERFVSIWPLIANNRNLERIAFIGNGEQVLWPLSSWTEAIDFLAGTLGPRLRHIEIGRNVGAFILRNIDAIAPQVTSFVYSGSYLSPRDDGYGKLLKDLAVASTPCSTTLQSLTMEWDEQDSFHIRTILSAFPSLRELATQGDNMDGRAQATEYDEIIHPLEKISGSFIEDTLHLNIRLPNLRHYGPTTFIWSDDELLAVLTAFPELEHLDAKKLCGKEAAPSAIVDALARLPLELALKTLIVRYGEPRPNTWTLLCARMPHLVVVELPYISNETLHVLGNNCRNLEHIKFCTLDPSKQTTRRPCYPEMTQLLTGCPRLKSCIGGNHSMWTSSLVQSPEWTCLGIEQLDCEILGVPRLNHNQRMLLATMKQQNRTVPQTEEEHIAVQNQETTLPFQRQVLQRLARFANLKELSLSTTMPKSIYNLDNRSRDVFGNYIQSDQVYQPDSELFEYEKEQLRYWRHRRPVPLNFCTLEMTLATGLAELATLKRLKKLSLKGVNHNLREPEIDWMVQNWPALREIDGLSAKQSRYFLAHRQQQ